MDAAEHAHAAAVAEVLRARAAGEIELRLGLEEFAALDRIPEEVAGWRTLARVNLDGTRVSDLSPLRGLPELWSISADDTFVADLAPLASLPGLRTLWLNRTPVRDLTPLSDLRLLEYLLLEATAVIDLTPLRRMRSLSNLSLQGTRVADISVLAEAGNIMLLSLDRSEVADIGPLRALRRLARLSLLGTAVQDVSPLAGLKHLAGLNLTGSQVADLRPLQNLSLLAGDPVDQRPTYGLHFRETPATQLDPELDRLSRISDNDDRGAQVLAYLRTLPPWPAPLSWLPSPETPDVPPAVAAPLQVAVRGGALRTVEQAPVARAAELGRAAILDYLGDLADHRGRIGNVLPRLGKALTALERALGTDSAGMNAIAVGTQGSRVIALAQGVDDDLMREDAADITAFAAALALFLEQFPEWRDYRDAAAPAPQPEAVQGALPEMAALVDTLKEQNAVDDAVPDVLDGLRRDAVDEPGDALVAKGLVRSAKNVVSALAGVVVSAWRVARREAADLGARWWDAQKKAIVGVAVVGTSTLTAQAVGLFQALGPKLAVLAQKIPAEFGWVTGFLEWLARVA